MTDDLESRADDYEKRLAEAGSSEDLIKALVKGAKRSQRNVKWLIITMILDIVFSLAISVLSIIAWNNVSNIGTEADIACARSNANATKLNIFIDALSDATLKVGAGNSQEIKDRVKTYQDSKATIYKC